MKPPKGVTLEYAIYEKEYSFRFTFSNGVVSVVDFKPIIEGSTGNIHNYMDLKKFKIMRVDYDRGDIYWGKNYDMCFHLSDYYGETQMLPNSK